MGDEYVAYKSPTTIVAETVYHFSEFGSSLTSINYNCFCANSLIHTVRGGMYGAAFGLVTPFHPPGSKAALQEAKTGIFKPAAPFSSISSVPHNAIIFGSLLAAQRFGCKSAEYVRSTQE